MPHVAVLPDDRRLRRRQLADQIIARRRALRLSRLRVGILAGVTPSLVAHAEYGLAVEAAAERILATLDAAAREGSR